MATSPIYPGHEQMYDDPLGSVVELHAPGFLGTNAQRLAFVTTGMTASKQWYETDTNLCYQWTGSAWQLIGVRSYGSLTGKPAIDVTTGLPTALTILKQKSGNQLFGSSANWSSGSANVTLTAGTWLLNGAGYFFNSGTTAGYTIAAVLFATADGANSVSVPTALATGGTITLKSGQAGMNPIATGSSSLSTTSAPGGQTQTLVQEPVIVAVSANNTIYLVPNANMTTPANAICVTDIWAKLISTATS